MIFLKAANGKLFMAKSTNCVCCGRCAGERGDAGDSILRCRAANCFFVIPGLPPQRRIYDQVNLPALDQIDNVRSALVDLVDRLGLDTGGLQDLRGSSCRHNLEAAHLDSRYIDQSHDRSRLRRTQHSAAFRHQSNTGMTGRVANGDRLVVFRIVEHGNNPARKNMQQSVFHRPDIGFCGFRHRDRLFPDDDRAHRM